MMVIRSVVVLPNAQNKLVDQLEHKLSANHMLGERGPLGFLKLERRLNDTF